MTKVDYIAVFLLAIGIPLFVLLWRRRKKFVEPHLYFPDVTALKSRCGKTKWANLPYALYFSALIFFSIAFINPRLFFEKHPNSGPHSSPPKEGIAIYLILDQSGSMKEQVVMQSGPKGLYMTTKIDLLKDVSKKFIDGDPSIGLTGRPNDLIGLVYFARAARVVVPLTFDHRVLLRQLDDFKEVGDKDQDGTSIGYAIYKTANMIVATKHYAEELAAKRDSKEAPSYSIKNSVMILITDGLQDPNPLDKGKRFRNIDVPEAAAYANENEIRLYIINVEPKMNEESFAPYQHIMQKAAQLTGGQFYMVDMTSGLEQIYSQIDHLEKSHLEQSAIVDVEKRPDLFHRASLAPYLASIGLLCFLVGVILETLILRRIP